MTNSALEYILVFLLSLLIIPIIYFVFPTNPELVVGIVAIAGSSIMIILLFSMRKLITELEGTTAYILRRVYMLAGILMIVMVSKVVLRLQYLDVIAIPELVDLLISGVYFAIVILFFYIVRDIIVQLKKLPKLYTANIGKSTIEK